MSGCSCLRTFPPLSILYSLGVIGHEINANSTYYGLTDFSTLNCSLGA